MDGRGMSESECPEAPDGGGHHWAPRAASRQRQKQQCRYCGMDYAAWREQQEQEESNE